jgi:hypothetical protein
MVKVVSWHRRNPCRQDRERSVMFRIEQLGILDHHFCLSWSKSKQHFVYRTISFRIIHVVYLIPGWEEETYCFSRSDVIVESYISCRQDGNETAGVNSTKICYSSLKLMSVLCHAGWRCSILYVALQS